ncbi:MAG: clostripain-related cysteine peptidase [Vulcanimicrobiota bacterium]
MNVSSISQARSFAPAARAAAPAQSSTLAADSVVLGQQQPPAQQPPTQQPPAQQPPAQQPPAQQPPTQQPPAPPQPELKEWTVLVYSVSDNNLYRYMQMDLDEAERVGSTNEMNLVTETSHQPRGGSVVRMKLETDNTSGLKSPVVQDLGPSHDMAKPQSLADSIAWAMKEYPSKHFMLICSDHGGGWKGAHHSESTDSWMNANDLEESFRLAQEQTGRKIDVLGFDECLMASTEIAHQLQPYADYMVASEETEGGAGWQYDESLGGAKTSNGNSRILSGKVLNYAAAALRNRDPLTPESMAKGIVQMAEGHQRDLGTMSAINLNKMPAVSAAVDNFAGVVLDSKLTKADFQSVAQKAQKFSDFADMGHFVELAGQKFGGKVAEAADQIKAAMAEAVVAEQHSTSYPNARGLNIEIDKQYSLTNLPNMEGEDLNRLSFDKYGNTKFAKETRWDEMLQKVR